MDITDGEAKAFCLGAGMVIALVVLALMTGNLSFVVVP